MACRLLDRITVQKREGPVMMRKPSSSEGGFRKDRKGHCQHISQKSQSVSQIEKTVPHPPARHCSSICLRRRLCKRDRRKRSFPTSTNQLLVGGTERESEIFPAVDVSSLLIAHIISEWGERRTERKWDSFYVPSSDPTRPWESSSTNDFTRCSRSLL
jgi:hypothetical protein